MKKVMLSGVFLAISSSMIAMEKTPVIILKSADAPAAKKAGDEKKSKDVTKVKPEKQVAKKHGLLACLSCDSCKGK